MKICLVTAFPPSKAGLNEYGYNLALQMAEDPTIELVILSDQLEGSVKELEGFNIIRCWKFDGWFSMLSLIREIRKQSPDVIWYNLLFTTFGNKKIPAFLGLMIPAVTRFMGYNTNITLHNLMEFVDLEAAGFEDSFINKLGGYVATQLLLLSKNVTVLLKKYRNLLHKKYGAQNILLRLHGIFDTNLVKPNIQQRKKRVLIFGKFGSYKKLDLIIETFKEMYEADPEVELMIAGGNHPAYPGYVEGVRDENKDVPNLTFTGYVPEEDLPQIFSESSVLALPYTSCTGTSGVAHLACTYGLPIVASDLDDFRSLMEEEGMVIKLFPVGDKSQLKTILLELLNSKETQEELSMKNYESARKMTMDSVVNSYIRFYKVEHHVTRLLSLNLIRTWPVWFPLRSRIYLWFSRRYQRSMEL